ncbi:uncharacterized protein At5g08430-like isoform X2 [Diospyros lotus]|uniref:uncharacterized protein At5g08430-like isoform X2 n=1 Tax=Diospyros lotus TaxID=55363 RepID=UPI0022564213|nr:uncharacterized protein At5g08430-like isoform X2 [Diospyros lotus]
MAKKKGKSQNKVEIAEDWCFSCKDGGKLIVCDHKQCLKAYHAECVEKDESFFETEKSWICNWHSCFICQRNSKFLCFCCPTAVCQHCILNAEFARVRGNKGFCNNCLKLALLWEENMDVDSDGEKVDLKDRNTYEGLFTEYWDIIKEKEGLTIQHLHAADAVIKKGKKSSSYRDESDKDEDLYLASDDDNDKEEEEEEDGLDECLPVQKRKRSKDRRLLIKKGVKSNKREFNDWGSKSLLDFLVSIGKDTTKKLSQYDVSSIIGGYINQNKLFQPDKKRKILCDEKLESVFGRKIINRNKIYDLLESHFLENLEPLEDEMGYSSEDEADNAVVTCREPSTFIKSLEDEAANAALAFRKQKKSSALLKSQEKEAVVNAPQSCFAAITPENIKLIYLKRSLVQELSKQPETFGSKVIGSFVRVKSDPSDRFQTKSHQLAQVTGIKELEVNNTEIILQVSNMSKDICISMLSDDNFSEEECEDLRQQVIGGLLKKLTIVELEQKARVLHEDITKHWIFRELALLQNLIDRANEKGRRRELFEYLERKQLLQTSAEQSRLLQKVPEVIAEGVEVKPRSKDATIEQRDESGGHRAAVAYGNSSGYTKPSSAYLKSQPTWRSNVGKSIQG